jgi:hypothetical protein
MPGNEPWVETKHMGEKAITAIKQARALDKKAENARELGLDYEPDYKVTVVDDQHPKGVPLAQWGKPAPVQEPVAWRFDQAKYRENDLRGRQWAFNVFSQTKPYMDEMVQNVTPLYTTPPAAQRQWVGLTDEEVGDLSDFAYANDEEFVRNVEAKLKEKNGGVV